MPHAEPDPTDPMILNGVVVDTDNDDVHRDMAACFIEEFLRMAFPPEQILKMFQSKGFTGPALAYRMLGESEIRAMIDRQVRIRGGRVAEVESTAHPRPDGNITLNVLDP